MATDELRQHPRVEASFEVRYTSVDQLMVAYTSDLSKGGMFLQTEAFLPVNAVVQIALSVPGAEAGVPIVCRVAYVRAGAPGKPGGMGLEFLEVGGEGLASIERYIAERLTAEATQAAPARRPMGVVVVDDDPFWRKVSSDVFRARGDLVRLAQDGFEALGLCLKQAPDLILSDINMPRMDGWQLLRMVRSRPSLAHVPFIFTTRLNGEAERLRGYQLGVDDYIGKPFRPEELEARVGRFAARFGQAAKVAERRSLRGDLGQVAAGSVLSFLEVEGKTGELLIVGPTTGRLLLRQGRPVRASVDDGKGGTALEQALRLLSWASGQFEFAAREVEGPDEIGLGATQLLLEHARRKDEAAR